MVQQVNRRGVSPLFCAIRQGHWQVSHPISVAVSFFVVMVPGTRVTSSQLDVGFFLAWFLDRGAAAAARR